MIMKYVLAHLAMTMLALASGAGVTYMVVSETTADVNYAVAMLALFMVVIAWIPAVIAGLSLEEELRYQKWRKELRRKMGRRKHPSKRVH